MRDVHSHLLESLFLHILKLTPQLRIVSTTLSVVLVFVVKLAGGGWMPENNTCMIIEICDVTKQS